MRRAVKEEKEKRYPSNFVTGEISSTSTKSLVWLWKLVCHKNEKHLHHPGALNINHLSYSFYPNSWVSWGGNPPPLLHPEHDIIFRLAPEAERELVSFWKKKILLIILFAWYFTAERSVWWSYNWPWMYIDQVSHLPNFEGIWLIKWTTQTHNFQSLKKTFINAGYSNDYFKHYHYFLYYPSLIVL